MKKGYRTTNRICENVNWSYMRRGELEIDVIIQNIALGGADDTPT